MMFFSHGSKPSVTHIIDSIVKFFDWSGLVPSINKSSSYLCNCDAKFMAWFDALGINQSNLPVKFLGVPLISSQLCINDCMPLVDKITSRLNAWSNLILSFAGRVLLIKSVVCAIEAFWCNHFLLPSAVHELVQSVLTRFLWKGNINHKGGQRWLGPQFACPRKKVVWGLRTWYTGTKLKFCIIF